MCGIAGIVVYGNSEPVTSKDLKSMCDAQRHRGPDDEGTWLSPDGRVGFGHRRLSIVDLSPLGHQPMVTADGRYSIVFNGEIYNFRYLRSDLQKLGARFVSGTDTEVLLHGYHAWGGEALLKKLRGMFAFALYDSVERETFFARDPLGIKPLYVSDDGEKVSFSSEVQSLKCVISDLSIDPEAVASFLSWGSIAPPRTLHKSIRAMPPGSFMRIRHDRVEGPETYYRLEDELGRSQAMDPEEAEERLRTALIDSVSHHLIADVPVGSFLSGGVDSSALVGLMAEVHDGPIRTVTLSMDAQELDESALARKAAELYGSEHHEIPMDIEQVRDRLMDAVQALDQPSIDGINTYFVAEAAVKAGLKVAVSGVGGDELFGGYGTFQMLPTVERFHRWAKSIPGGSNFLSTASTMVERFPRSLNQTRFQRALRHGGTTSGAYFAVRGLFSPTELRALLAPAFKDLADACDPVAELAGRVHPGDLPPEERTSALEFRQYLQCQLLRDTDATAMRHSLEVRTPLVDTELLCAAAAIPAALRQAGPAKKYLRMAPRPPVPDALWDRKKQGFTLPFDAWIRGGGISTELPQHECLDPIGVASIKKDYLDNKLTWSRLWAMVVLREYLN